MVTETGHFLPGNVRQKKRINFFFGLFGKEPSEACRDKFREAWSLFSFYSFPSPILSKSEQHEFWLENTSCLASLPSRVETVLQGKKLCPHHWVTFLVHVGFLGEKKESEVAQSCVTLCDPMDCSPHQAPPCMGFSRQEYWSGLPFPFAGGLPHPGIERGSATLQADSLPTEPPGNPIFLGGSVARTSLPMQETQVPSLGRKDPLEEGI